jgi:uncharacterized coiled-coil DUF342 family protein
MMDTNTIIQGIILLGAGGLTPYLIKQESRIKRLETKQEQGDIDSKKLDLLFDKISEVKEIVMDVKAAMESHTKVDRLEKESILSKIKDLKDDIEQCIYGNGNDSKKAHRN